MKNPQLTLNNSNIITVVMNRKTGKFFRNKYNKETDRLTDFTWTDQVRLATNLLGINEDRIKEELSRIYNIEESEYELKYFQLQYVEVKK
jgi:hypothetical protein